MTNLIKIKDVSAKYDITARTLRYYEDMGLIESIRSNDVAYRMYDENAIKRIEQILILRKLNINVRDIQRIFNASGSEIVLEVLGKKVQSIDDEVALLHELKEIVVDFIQQIEQIDFGNNSDVKLLYNKAKEIETHLINVDYVGKPSNVTRFLEVTEKVNKSVDVRVIHFPAMKMISSGPIQDMESLNAFDNWWSGIDVKNYITPRDFMYHDQENHCMIWLFAPPENYINTSKYEYIDFTGGFYAVCSAKDGDVVDMDNAKAAIKKWLNESSCFAESTTDNDIHKRYVLTHVCTPKIFKEKMGYHLTDIFIPIITI